MRIKCLSQRAMGMILSIVLLLLTACNPTKLGVSPTLTLAPQPTNTLIPNFPASATFTPPTLPTGTPAPAVPCFTSYIDPFAFLPDSSSMLVRAEMGVQQFNLQTMQQEGFINSPSNLNGPVVALSPEGEKLAWALEDGTIQLVRVSGQAVLTSIKSGQTSPLKLEFTPTGDRLFSSSHDGTLKVWGMDGNLVNGFQPGGGEIMNIGLSPDGTMLATIPSDGEITLWNADNFKVITGLSSSGGYDTSDVVFSPNGEYIAADLATGLFLWKMPEKTELLGTRSPINSMAVAFSADGRLLAYADQNNIVLRSPDGSQILRTLVGHQSPIFELLFSPDGSTLVSADDMEIRIWRVEDGGLLAIGKTACP
jgi:WD40 repeat protein